MLFHPYLVQGSRLPPIYYTAYRLLMFYPKIDFVTFNHIVTSVQIEFGGGASQQSWTWIDDVESSHKTYEEYTFKLNSGRPSEEI